MTELLDRFPDGVRRTAVERAALLESNGDSELARILIGLIKVGDDLGRRYRDQRRHAGQLMVNSDRIAQESFARNTAAEHLAHEAGHTTDAITDRVAADNLATWKREDQVARFDKFRGHVLALFSETRGIPSGPLSDTQVEALRQNIFKANEVAITASKPQPTKEGLW